MKVVIVEDEKIAANRLEKLLIQIDSSIEVIAKLGSIKSSVDWFKNNKAELIFLDIQLSDGLSFSIFDQLSIKTPVIFTTAYDQYAIKAFQLNSISYLLKPIRESELKQSLSKYNELIAALNIDFKSLLKEMNGEKISYKKRFLIHAGDKLKKIDVDDIAYFYALEKNVFIKTFNKTSYAVDYTLDALDNILNPEQFFRINRKYIVNMNSISEMIAYSRGRVKLNLNPAADEELDAIVSVERSPKFKQWMNN